MHRLLAILLCLIPGLSFAGWVSEGAVCRSSLYNQEPGCFQSVTSKGFLTYWGGKILEMEFGADGWNGNVRVRVTHVSDETEYRCGQVLQFNYNEDLKDLTHLSLAMRKCN